MLGSGVAVNPTPAEAAGPVRVLSYNICGASCNNGVIDKAGSNNDVVEDVRNRIQSRRYHLVMLQEVCVAQFSRLKSLLKNAGWSMDGVFRAQRSNGKCKGGAGFGDAVFSHGGVHDTEVVQLPDRGKEDRAVLCIDTDAEGSVLACTLHLVTGKENGQQERLDQLAAIDRAFSGRAENRAVVLGGDFNTPPSGMGDFLSPSRGGEFFDVDPQLAVTHGKKIDYILFSRNHFSGPSGGPEKTKYSDHRLLKGQATRG